MDNDNIRYIRVDRIKDAEYYKNKIPLNFSIDTINTIAEYVLSDSVMINRGNLYNLRKLFVAIDDRVLQKNHEVYVRFLFIKRMLKRKLDEYIVNKSVLIEASRSPKYAECEDKFINEIRDIVLRAAEIKFVNNLVADKLNYLYLWTHKDEITDEFKKLEKGEFESYKNINKTLKKLLSTVLGDMRKVSEMNSNDITFSLKDDQFAASVSKTSRSLKAPSSVLKTNITYLNEMLNGGFYSKKIYLLAGLSGGKYVATHNGDVMKNNFFNCWENIAC